MRLLDTPFYTLDVDPSVPLVIFRRRDVPYPSCSAIEAEAKRIEQAYTAGGHKSFHLLVDLRPSLPRNDPDFEKAIVTFRRQLVRYAQRIAVLVHTATGILQVQRHIRDDSMDARIFQEEQEALAYLLGSGVATGKPPSVLPASVPISTAAGSGRSRPPQSGQG